MIKHSVLFSIVFVLFQINVLIAQVNQHFVQHLSQFQLKKEHITYLNSFEEVNDSLHYYKAKFHLQYGNDELFMEELKNCENLFFRDSLAVRYSNMYFMNRDRNFSNIWFTKSKDNGAFENELSSLYWAIENPRNYAVNDVPEFIQNDFLRYKKADNKKPLLAAAFSTLLPGSGKLYIGSYRSFFQTLLYMTLSGWQTYESYKSLGLKHPLTIVNGGLFTTFYVVNIFGSFRETKTKKKEIRNQLLFDAHKYYSLHNSYPLY